MNPPRTHRLGGRTLALCLLMAFSTTSAGCRTPEFYELEAFSDPIMSLGDNAAETHFHQKVFYSMEGSAGGIGTGAGGGCGCY